MQSESDKVPSLRVKPRLKVFQPIELITNKGCVRGHLLDVSVGGALVHTQSAPAQGSFVKLTIIGEVQLARVVWTNGPRFGAAFVFALLETQVQQLIGLPTGLGTRLVDGDSSVRKVAKPLKDTTDLERSPSAPRETTTTGNASPDH